MGFLASTCFSRWVLALGFATVFLASPAGASPVKTDHVTAELVAERSAALPGQPLQIGLRLQHIPHWHTYWRNPGDSGLPTTLSWTLPSGSQVGEIEWPAPKRLPVGPLVNYGYEDEVLLPLRYTPPTTAKAGDTLKLVAQANWLVCSDVCIPENATLELQLPVMADGATPGNTAHAALFARTAAAQPVPLSGWNVQLQRSGQELLLSLQPAAAPAADKAPPIEVFPYPDQTLEPAKHEVYRTPQGYAVKLALMDGAQLPDRLAGIAVATGPVLPWGGEHAAVEFNAPVQRVDALVLPAGAQRMAAGPAGGSPAAALRGGVEYSLLGVLALAFFGGMVLNLMPCVFPILSIKLLGLVQHHEDRRSLRVHALAYGAGVILSFLALAGVLLALRAAGSAVGWGFQLQEPGVVFLLALLFFVLGLNLIGAFEFGTLMPQQLAGWRARRPAADAFGSGILAVLAASPCTAPFMGAALGYAVTQSPALALGVFAALGLGMALPYVVLAVMPAWHDRLPRPGPWMLRLKQALAFPMFATVVWLVWVLGQQAGIDGAAKALLALVGLAFVLWLLGLSKPRGALARSAGGAALLGVLLWSWPAALSSQQQAANAGTAREHDALAAAWEPYDEAAIAQHVAQGRPVFVDFTAAWCVSCQVNKRLVLNTEQTMQAFNNAKVVLMRADWTQRNPQITEALARLGRNGVPVYVLMRPGREALLLPEILTSGLVREALATL